MSEIGLMTRCLQAGFRSSSKANRRPSTHLSIGTPSLPHGSNTSEKKEPIADISDKAKDDLITTLRKQFSEFISDKGDELAALDLTRWLPGPAVHDCKEMLHPRWLV